VTPQSRVRGLRGAITVPADEPDAIMAATTTLLRELFDRNQVSHDDLVSIIFTSTADLTAEFPAAAARAIGISDVPLMCSQEIPVRGSLERCIRVLVHLYTERDYAELRHVYLGGAAELRADLGSAEE
jgi:monofunctional chorismate mutase